MFKQMLCWLLCKEIFPQTDNYIDPVDFQCKQFPGIVKVEQSSSDKIHVLTIYTFEQKLKYQEKPLSPL